MRRPGWVLAMVWALVLGALFLGCASPPPREVLDVHFDVPAGWSVVDTTGGRSLEQTANWWREFKSSPLDSLIKEAITGNFDLKAAVARVDEAAALARRAGADLWPQESLRADASKRRQNLIGIPIPGFGNVIASRVTTFGVSLDVAWEVDLWGRVRSGRGAALADVQASWADLAALRLSIAAQTVKAWFAVVESRLQMELAEQTVDSFDLSADQVRARYERGVRSSLDLRLALANLHSAEALLEQRREVFDRAVRQLEILLGRYPSATLVAAGDLPAIAGAVPAGLPSELLIRRPDLLAAERRYAAAEKRVSQARRAFFPQINLTGSAGTLAADLKDLVNGDFGVWSVAAGLTQPLFQGGRLLANLSQSSAVADQALAQYAGSLLRAFAEVESAIYAEEVLARREHHLSAAAAQSEAARRLAERQYGVGIVDYITVLETQRRALNARSEWLSVSRARLDARVNLHLALGGGFDLNKRWTEFLLLMSMEEVEASGE